LIPLEFAKPPNVEELKAKILSLEQRIDTLETIQKDDVMLMENYGPRSHALFCVSPKLGKELVYYNTIRERPLFSFHSGLTFQGIKTAGWVIMDKSCKQEVLDFLSALKVKHTTRPVSGRILQMMGM